MYDGVTSICQPFAPSATLAAMAEFEKRLSPEEKSSLPKTRMTTEYMQVLNEVRGDALEQVRRNAGKERQACEQMLEQ